MAFDEELAQATFRFVQAQNSENAARFAALDGTLTAEKMQNVKDAEIVTEERRKELRRLYRERLG